MLLLNNTFNTSGCHEILLIDRDVSIESHFIILDLEAPLILPLLPLLRFLVLACTSSTLNMPLVALAAIIPRSNGLKAQSVTVKRPLLFN